MLKRKVVVTGMGIICALGNGKKEVTKNLMTCKNRMSYLSELKDYGNLGDVKAGIVHTNNPMVTNVMDLDKSEYMARIAIDEACSNAGLTKQEFEKLGGRMALSLSTSVMGSDYIMKYIKDNASNGSWIIHSKAYVSRFAKEYSIKGGCYTTSSACASGTAGIGIAYDLICHDKADVVLCGGTDHITDISIYGFHALDTICKDISKPFDKERDGINIGEGSAFFIFEEYEHAQNRNVPILAEVLGYGLSNDAYHVTSPDPSGDGARRSMQMALKEAQISNGKNVYINAHGTGTKANDPMELSAIKQVFPEESVLISSTKSLTGHCLGAAGSVEFAFSLIYLEEGKVPKTANSNCDIEGGELYFDGWEERNTNFNTVISNSFAFGGNDATIIIRK